MVYPGWYRAWCTPPYPALPCRPGYSGVHHPLSSSRVHRHPCSRTRTRTACQRWSLLSLGGPGKRGNPAQGCLPSSRVLNGKPGCRKSRNRESVDSGRVICTKYSPETDSGGESRIPGRFLVLRAREEELPQNHHLLIFAPDPPANGQEAPPCTTFLTFPRVELTGILPRAGDDRAQTTSSPPLKAARSVRSQESSLFALLRCFAHFVRFSPLFAIP